MRLSDWKIGTRLGSGFLLLVIMIFFICCVSIINLSNFNTAAHNIVIKSYPQTVDANNLMDNVNAVVLEYQKLLLCQNNEKEKEILLRMEEIKNRINHILEKIKGSVEAQHDNTSSDLFNGIQSLRKEFLTSGQAIIDLVNTGDRTGAVTEFNNNMDRLQSDYRVAINSLIDHQRDKMNATVTTMDHSYNFSRGLLLIILAVCILCSTVLAYVMTHSVTQPINQALAIAQRVASGDLTSDIQATSKDETGMLLRALADMNSNLQQMVSLVRDGAESISSATSQIAAGTQDLSSRTEEQASSLEETASSMEQLASTIKNTSDHTQHATAVANKAADTAKQSSNVMISVTQKMRGINQSSQRMAEIIGVIDSIAFQTNILALNAAVEAARAGEEGRGFAVVAGEVRSLAQRSASAAKEIRELIDHSVGQIHDGMNLVDKAEENIAGLTTNVEDVNNIISEIAQASHEQSEGILQINVAIGQIDSTTQQNAALVEESASAAASMQSQSAHLADAVHAFKLNRASLSNTYLLEPTVTATKTKVNSEKVENAPADNDDWMTF